MGSEQGAAEAIANAESIATCDWSTKAIAAAKYSSSLEDGALSIDETDVIMEINEVETEEEVCRQWLELGLFDADALFASIDIQINLGNWNVVEIALDSITKENSGTPAAMAFVHFYRAKLEFSRGSLQNALDELTEMDGLNLVEEFPVIYRRARDLRKDIVEKFS
jgi:hypothetical protein